MAVDNTVNTWEPLVDLAVDVALQVARLCVLLDRFGRFYVIFDQVVLRAHQSRWHIARHPESGSVVWGADRNVTICIQDIVPVEDVGCGYKTAEQVFKSNLLAFGEISGRHLFCGELEEACGETCDSCTAVR